MDYTERSNSWQPAENIKKIKRKRTIKAKETSDKRPVKILARFEQGWCLMKWANGRTSIIQLSTKQTYEVIVSGVLTIQ